MGVHYGAHDYTSRFQQRSIFDELEAVAVRLETAAKNAVKAAEALKLENEKVPKDNGGTPGRPAGHTEKKP